MIRYAGRGRCTKPPAERAGSGDDIERVARLQPTPSATAFPPSPRQTPGLSSFQEPNVCRVCGARYVVDSLARDCEVRHMTDVIRVTDNTPKAEIADLLGGEAFDDVWQHSFLNELLDDWEHAPAS